MKKYLLCMLASFSLLSIVVSPSSSLWACTHFQLEAADKTIIIGRSMEFDMYLKSELVMQPRGDNWQTRTPSGTVGLKWLQRYGYVMANALGLDVAVDGLNEKGLAVGGLWLPGITKYQEVPADAQDRAISILDLGLWLLGSFSTVEEVKKALPTVYVWGAKVKELGDIVPPVHYAVHDATGAAIVIEFIDGKMQVHDNPNGVLTNAPDFKWQLTNLRNYVNLKALNVKPIDLAGTVLGPTGEGSGLLGIPGDWTPPSRFVRATTFKRLAQQPANAKEGVNLATHILNTVDIPMGVIREKPDSTKGDFTQWVVIKDLTNRVFYFRSYENLRLRGLDLKKLDFSKGVPKGSMPMHGGDGIEMISAGVSKENV